MATFTYTFEDLTDSNVDWTYTSPTAGSAVVAVGGTNGLWHFDTDETVSVGVGPFNGETVEGTSAGYIFTEMSGQTAGDVWTMQWDNTLDAAANDYTFTFHWCARGTEASPIITVETNEASAGWVVRLTTGDTNNGGDEVIPDTSAVTGDTPWHQKSVDLASVISNANTLIRIRIQCDTDPAASAQFWHNDIGIDSITIQEDSLFSHEQDSFRFYDDGTESGSTALQNQNVDLTTAQEDTFQVRIGGQLTGDPPALSVTLEYKKTGDADAEFRKVP